MRTSSTWILASSLIAVAVAACTGEATVTPPPTAPVAATPTTTVAAAAHPPLTPDAIAALLAAPDRTDADRKTDVHRHPADLLAFMGVGPGMTVADLGAAGGYTTELLVRAVGPTGKVYGQNDPEMLKKFMEPRWSARLAAPINKAVIRSDRPFDAPLPPDEVGLDLVVDFIFYHDATWMGVDRAKMNAAVFAALKPGGVYFIVDSSAKDGHGIADVKTLHRIEQSVVENEVKAAGFTLAGKAEFLRNPADTRDWSSSPGVAGDRIGTEDRFVLKFVKP